MDDRGIIKGFMRERSALWKLAGAFLLVFFFTFLFFSIIGFVPEDPHDSTDHSGADATLEAVLADSSQYEAPTRIIIEKINIDVVVNNPETTDIAVLDQALLQGAVRYPGSGKVGEKANMFLFGHSSYLPVVHNQAFRAFNDIQKLSEGDLIRVQSLETEEVYRVTRVQNMNASDALVELRGGEKKLTLSTCDSFGKPSERFVVEAAFVGSSPVPSSQPAHGS